MLLIPILLPMIAAVLCYLEGRRSKDGRDLCVIGSCLAELLLAVAMFLFVVSGHELHTEVPGFCAMGMSFRLDGFRALYVLVAGVMWFFTSVLSRQYFAKHYHNRNRYYFFFLMTLGATVGVFLSADLYTTFIFFEIMSFTSYTWVAHDETPEAMRAAETYLAVAIIGGMVMLMGLMLLWMNVGTLQIDRLYEAAAASTNPGGVFAASLCILLGFGAKAGMFPVHIWLPKAHPVAPAPASALLSGILTKTGIYGVIVVSCEIFRDSVIWGNLILVLGLITMLGGAVLAVFSVNLKRTLACSSMSQIGFILTGISMTCLLGEHNALAARGTLLYMVNHSLFKLILFMVAGVVYMNLHKLGFNDIRGFGRKKPVLHFAFLMGMFGLMGIPLGSGYVSKTLIHESIVEYVELLAEHGARPLAFLYTGAEWLFLFSGGLTAAYMIKLYVCLFWKKNPDCQPAYDEWPHYMNGASRFALLATALLVPLLGVRPNLTMDFLADVGGGFLHAGHLHHAVEYFSLGNLKGAGISLSIGLAVYLALIRPLMTRRKQGDTYYLNLWPPLLDLEDRLYRPAIEGMLSVGYRAASVGRAEILEKRIYHPLLVFLESAGSRLASAGRSDILEDRVFRPVVKGAEHAGAALAGLGHEEKVEGRVYAPLIRLLSEVGTLAGRFLSGLADRLGALLTLKVLQAGRRRPRGAEEEESSLAHVIGNRVDEAKEQLNRTLWRENPREHHAEEKLTGFWRGMVKLRQMLTHTMSYSLLVFGIGLCLMLIYLMFLNGRI